VCLSVCVCACGADRRAVCTLRANINMLHRHTQKKCLKYANTYNGHSQTNHLLVAKTSRQHTATHSNKLQHTTTHGNTRQTHSNTQQHTATHGNTTFFKTYAAVLPQGVLRRTVPRCSTLQHIATQHFATLTLPCRLARRRPSTARTIFST